MGLGTLVGRQNTQPARSNAITSVNRGNKQFAKPISIDPGTETMRWGICGLLLLACMCNASPTNSLTDEEQDAWNNVWPNISIGPGNSTVTITATSPAGNQVIEEYVSSTVTCDKDLVEQLLPEGWKLEVKQVEKKTWWS